MEDIETWLEKFELVAEEGVPIKVDKGLVLKQMELNGLLLDEELQNLDRGIIYRKGRIRIRLWSDRHNIAEVNLMDSGKIINYIEFPIVNDESELTRESELKRMLDFCYARYVKNMNRRFTSLRYVVTGVNKKDGLARICLEEDKEFDSEKAFWEERITPLVREYNNEVEIYMALAGFLKSLEQGFRESKEFRYRNLAYRLKISIEGLMRMLRDEKNLMVKTRMPKVDGYNVEEIYKQVFMDSKRLEEVKRYDNLDLWFKVGKLK